MRLFSRLALLSALALAFVGCSKTEDTGGGATAAAKKKAVAAISNSTLLEMVPADSPYVMASLTKMPADFLAKMGSAMDPMMKMAEKEMAKAKTKIGATPTGEDKIALALIQELEGNLNLKGWEKLGFDPGFRMVMYGIGFIPALRIQLSDPKALKAAIARVETKGGKKAPTAKLGDLEYWEIRENGAVFAAAIIGDQLVIGGAPEPLAGEILPLLFNKKPGKNAGDVLKGITNKHGFAGMTGYADLMGIAKILLDQGTGTNASVWKALKGGGPAMPAECQTEIAGMVANFPRAVFGYTQIDGKAIGARYVLETASALGKELAGLTSAVPGLGDKGTPMMSFGLALDTKKVMDFAKAKLNSMKAAPYKCMFLKDMNEGINQASQGLAMAPVPPMVFGIRGINLVLKSMKMGANGPSDIHATVIVAMEKADQVLTMAGSMVPPLANFKVAMDGKPVALPAGLIPPVVDAPHVAMNDKGIAFSVGTGEEKGLTALLNGKATKGPIMAGGYDMSQFMDMMKGTIGYMGAEEKMIFNAVTGILGYAKYTLSFKEVGIVVDQHVTFK